MEWFKPNPDAGTGNVHILERIAAAFLINSNETERSCYFIANVLRTT